MGRREPVAEVMAAFVESTGRALVQVDQNTAYIDSKAGSRVEIEHTARTWWISVDGVRAGHRPWPHTAVALMVQELCAEEGVPMKRSA